MFLDKIIHIALHNRLAILIAAVLIMVVGIFTAKTMDVDVFPDLNAPTVVVMTEYQMLAVWGGKMIYPECVCVAYWTFDTQE